MSQTLLLRWHEAYYANDVDRMRVLAAITRTALDFPEDEIVELEAKVNERWGTNQWDWTIGKCPEGFFYCCGGETKWTHRGHASTLTASLQAMLDIPSEDV